MWTSGGAATLGAGRFRGDGGFGNPHRREPSVNPILHSRRAELAAAQALTPIPGVQDRQRLRVAVWFPAPAAIAAKTVTGAHVDSSKWQAPRYPQPMLIAI